MPYHENSNHIMYYFFSSNILPEVKIHTEKYYLTQKNRSVILIFSIKIFLLTYFPLLLTTSEPCNNSSLVEALLLIKATLLIFCINLNLCRTHSLVHACIHYSPIFHIIFNEYLLVEEQCSRNINGH